MDQEYCGPMQKVRCAGFYEVQSCIDMGRAVNSGVPGRIKEAKRVKTYELNRKTYKDVKKMDHGHMSDFCREIYQSGYEEGKKAAEGLSEDDIRRIILEVKGIGEKKAEDIVLALKAAQNGRGVLTDV